MFLRISLERGTTKGETLARSQIEPRYPISWQLGHSFQRVLLRHEPRAPESSALPGYGIV